MSAYWYEIFIDKGEYGTETIQAFGNLKIARVFLNAQRKAGIKCGLDKWAMVNGDPENIDLIEAIA